MKHEAPDPFWAEIGISLDLEYLRKTATQSESCTGEGESTGKWSELAQTWGPLRCLKTLSRRKPWHPEIRTWGSQTRFSQPIAACPLRSQRLIGWKITERTDRHALGKGTERSPVATGDRGGELVLLRAEETRAASCFSIKITFVYRLVGAGKTQQLLGSADSS